MTRLGASKFILPLALILLVQCPKAESGKLANLLESILGALQNIEKLLKDDSITINNSPALPSPKLPSTGRRAAQPDNNDAIKNPSSQEILTENALHGISHKSPKPTVTAKLNKNVAKTQKEPKLRSKIEQSEDNIDSSSLNKNGDNEDRVIIEPRLFSEDEEAS